MVSRGPLYMTIAALVFTVMVVAVKSARVTLSGAEVIAWRSLVAVPFVLLLGWRHILRVQRKGLLFVRSGLGFAAVFCFVTAAGDLSVANLSLLHKLQPIWIALLAPVFLGGSERVETGVWFALGVGLCGSVLILQPTIQGDMSTLGPGLLAALGAFFSALAHISLRALGRTEPTPAVVFWFQFSLLPFAVIFGAVNGVSWTTFPELSLLPALVVIGITAVCGQLLMTQAYKLDRAAKTAAASYTGPFWAYLVDYFVFDVTPTPAGLVGGGLLIGAGIYLLLLRSKPTSPDTKPKSAGTGHSGELGEVVPVETNQS